MFLCVSNRVTQLVHALPFVAQPLPYRIAAPLHHGSPPQFHACPWALKGQERRPETKEGAIV